MKRGSSAFISTGGQWAETLAASSWYQTSRPGCMAISPPVCLTTITFLMPPFTLGSATSTFFLRWTALPPRRPSSAVITTLESQSSTRLARLSARSRRRRWSAPRRCACRPASHRRPRDHRQVDGDGVALLDAVGLQHVGEAADLLMQLPVGDLLRDGGIVPLEDDRRLVRAPGEVPVHAVVRDVGGAVLVPFDRDLARLVRDVLDLGVGLEPVDPLAVLAPEGLGVGERGLVHLLVLGVVDVGALLPGLRDGVELLGHLPHPKTGRPDASAAGPPLSRCGDSFTKTPASSRMRR